MQYVKNCKDMKTHCENHEKCMQMVQAVLDGSASEEEMAHFRDNYDLCRPCFDGYHLEKSIKEALSVKLQKKCCPPSTIIDIRSRIGLALVGLGFVAMQALIYHAWYRSN